MSPVERAEDLKNRYMDREATRQIGRAHHARALSIPPYIARHGLSHRTPVLVFPSQVRVKLLGRKRTVLPLYKLSYGQPQFNDQHT